MLCTCFLLNPLPPRPNYTPPFCFWHIIYDRNVPYGAYVIRYPYPNSWWPQDIRISIIFLHTSYGPILFSLTSLEKVYAVCPASMKHSYAWVQCVVFFVVFLRQLHLHEYYVLRIDEKKSILNKTSIFHSCTPRHSWRLFKFPLSNMKWHSFAFCIL